MGFFHAQCRRSNCQQMGTDYVILDGVEGKGRYLGTVLGVRNACQELGWWGEGEVKMYFDGETQPTICGTGAEDYIGCAWELEEVCAPQDVYKRQFEGRVGDRTGSSPVDRTTIPTRN